MVIIEELNGMDKTITITHRNSAIVILVERVVFNYQIITTFQEVETQLQQHVLELFNW